MNRRIKKWEDRKDAVKPNVQKALDNNDMEALEKAMSPLQFAFCNEYIKDFNGSQAVLRSGSSCKDPHKLAYQWMSNPGVRAYIDYLLRERTERMKVDQGFIVEKLVKTLVKAEEDNNHQATLRAAELLAKHLGMFIERQEITGKDGEAIKYEEVSNEAADFLSSITRLATREGTGRDTGETVQ
jgi:phage terminase small subunit